MWLTTFCRRGCQFWKNKSELLVVQKCANFVDLKKRYNISINLQKSALLAPRTSPPKFYSYILTLLQFSSTPGIYLFAEHRAPPIITSRFLYSGEGPALQSPVCTERKKDYLAVSTKHFHNVSWFQPASPQFNIRYGWNAINAVLLNGSIMSKRNSSVEY